MESERHLGVAVSLGVCVRAHLRARPKAELFVGVKLLKSLGRIEVKSKVRATALVQGGVEDMALQGPLLLGDRDQRCGHRDPGQRVSGFGTLDQIWG